METIKNKRAKVINELKTSRQTWHGVALYTSAEEATAHGFALMYEDERGSVYGIRNAEAVAAGNFGKWDKVAFVPDSEYMEEYAAQAVEDVPTLEEIAQQRAENAQAIKAKKEESENARREWDELDKTGKTKYLLSTPAEQRIMRKWEAIDKDIARLQNIALILRHNYRVALAAQVLPAFLEVLKKYGGKKAGDKTREKMRNDMITACGCSVWFERSILSQKSQQANISEIIRGAWNGEKIEIYTKNGANIIDEQNNINGNLTADDLRIYTGEYIDNPAARLDEINKAAEAVEAARQAFNDAADRLNALQVDGFKRVARISGI